MVASTHWLASSGGDGRARARRERVRRRGGGRVRAAGRRAAHERAGRRSAAAAVGRVARARDLRAGAGARGGDASTRTARSASTLVPGVGPYAACVPGAFDAWCTLLRDFGTWELADVLAYAIGYARDGFPATPGIVSAIARMDPAWDGLGGDLAGSGRATAQPDARGHVRAAGVVRRRVPGSADRRRARRLVPRLGRGAACRPGSSRATTWRAIAPWSRSRCRCGSGTGRCSRPARGARDRCSCSNSRCSTAWSSVRSSASSTSTPCSRARSSRSRTATPGTATPRRSRWSCCSRASTRPRAAR